MARGRWEEESNSSIMGGRPQVREVGPEEGAVRMGGYAFRGKSCGPGLVLEGCGVWSSSRRGEGESKMPAPGHRQGGPHPAPKQPAASLGSCRAGPSSASENTEQEPGQGGAGRDRVKIQV